MGRRIALLGNGGFAKEVAEILVLTGDEVIASYGSTDTGFAAPYRGYLNKLAADREDFDAVVLAIGATSRRTLAKRAELSRWLEDQGIGSIPVVSPHAIISSGVIIEDGAFVGHGAIIGVDAIVRGEAVDQHWRDHRSRCADIGTSDHCAWCFRRWWCLCRIGHHRRTACAHPSRNCSGRQRDRRDWVYSAQDRAG